MRTKHFIPGGFAALAGVLLAGSALAQDADPAAASGLNSGDVAWILTSSAIVLMMTIPGLALFYGGLVRGKNVLSILMQCFVTAAIISVTWVLWGYSIAFGPDQNGLYGDLSHWALSGVSHLAGPDENIPAQAFMVFQLMFAIITPALIVGAIAERMKFSAFLLFVVLWSTFIYSPLAHWVWHGDGWLLQRGALDFAGGTVVHISSGTSALVAAAMMGRRRGYGREPMPPHNVPFVVIGAALLWVGWFGFNAGSALAANGMATIAFVNTNTATGAAVLGWMFSEWIGRGSPTAVGAASGAVAGLVAITPAAGFVEPSSAIVIGLVAGFLCYKACNWKTSIGYDDALDVVGVHGVGGTWGAIATGIFAASAVGGTAGLIEGNAPQVWTQIVAVGATYLLCGFGTFVILGIVNSVVGLRVDEEDEVTGLDLSMHSESAYSTAGVSTALGEIAPVSERRRRRASSGGSSGSSSGGGGASSVSGRQPPGSSGIRRDPPSVAARAATVESAPATAVGGTPNGVSAAAEAVPSNGAGRTYRLIVDSVDSRALTRWWRDLCTQDRSKAPPAFQEFFPHVSSFDGTTFHCTGGDAETARERLGYLLNIYGAQAGNVQIERD